MLYKKAAEKHSINETVSGWMVELETCLVIIGYLLLMFLISFWPREFFFIINNTRPHATRLSAKRAQVQTCKSANAKGNTTKHAHKI